MTDLFELLDRAAGAEVPVDLRRLEADVVRGRRALLRRRLAATSAGLAAAASVAVVTTVAVAALPGGTAQVVVPGAGGPATTRPPIPTTTSAAATVPAGHGGSTTTFDVPPRTSTTGPDGVVTAPATSTTTVVGSEKDMQTPVPPALVETSDGAGLALRPSLAPKGWTVDGNDFVTTFSPPRVTTVPDDFEGKFVVSLATPPPGADLRDIAEVDGVTYYGWLGDDPTSQTFGMRLPDGRYLQFQAITPDLSVGSGYAVRLMLGITVTAQARAGVG